LDLFKHDLTDSSGSNVPMIANCEGSILNLGVGMYPSLMGYFDLPTPIQTSLVFFISHVANQSEYRQVPFQTNYLNDSWTLPNTIVSTQGEGLMGMASPLFAVETAYLEITANSVQDLLEKEEIDEFTSPAWLLNSPKNVDPNDLYLPSDEVVMESMIGLEKPWEDLHQRSYSLLNLDNMQEVEQDLLNYGGCN